MSYQEELVQRLMRSGEWDELTTERRESFQKLDEQLAGALMTWQDEEDANGAAPRGALASRQAVDEHFLNSFRTLSEVFGGQLICRHRGSIKLTKLGLALGVFLHEAEKVGCSISQFESQLINITTGCMTIVKTLHSPCDNDST